MQQALLGTEAGGWGQGILLDEVLPFRNQKLMVIRTH